MIFISHSFLILRRKGQGKKKNNFAKQSREDEYLAFLIGREAENEIKRGLRMAEWGDDEREKR